MPEPASPENDRPRLQPQRGPMQATAWGGAPLGGSRAQAVKRLQVGIAGVFAIILLVGLVSVVDNRAELTEANSVPEAASTAQPNGAATQSDPLVEAGVVPDLPASPPQAAPGAATGTEGSGAAQTPRQE